MSHISRHDFAAAGRVKRNLKLKIRSWTDKTGARFDEQWRQVSRTPVEATIANIDAMCFEELQSGWPDGVAFDFSLNQPAINGFLFVEKKALAVLLTDVLGGDEADEPSDVLTGIELALCELIFELCVLSFCESWVGSDPLAYELVGLELAPDRSRRFSGSEDVLILDLRIENLGQPVVIQVIVGKKQFSDLLGVVPENQGPLSTKTVDPVRISKIEVELVAELGRAKVDVDELMAIEPGDVIVLDQAVQREIPILVNDNIKFVAWPGILADRRVVKISSNVEQPE